MCDGYLTEGVQFGGEIIFTGFMDFFSKNMIVAHSKVM
jgi:hypothetical protein